VAIVEWKVPKGVRNCRVFPYSVGLFARYRDLGTQQSYQDFILLNVTGVVRRFEATAAQHHRSGLKLTADAVRFEREGRGPNIFRKPATACCPVAFKPSPFRIGCYDMLPSPQVLKSPSERFGISVIRERIFGQDCAKTLTRWRNNFRATSPHLMPSGFGDRVRRLCEFYLAYCGAGFLSGISTRARLRSQSRNSSHRTIG